MVKTDVGDDGEDRGDDVGAIQSASQSNFCDGDIYLLLGKILKCQGGGQFEERTVQWLEEVAFLLHEVDDILLWDALAVYTDALTEIHEMWGGV